jgi:hypothetical protein
MVEIWSRAPLERFKTLDIGNKCWETLAHLNVQKFPNLLKLCKKIFSKHIQENIQMRFQALHKIDEGHVGVYYRGGALLPGIAHPGIDLTKLHFGQFSDKFPSSHFGQLSTPKTTD